jgi:hypothetical protein
MSKNSISGAGQCGHIVIISARYLRFSEYKAKSILVVVHTCSNYFLVFLA